MKFTFNKNNEATNEPLVLMIVLALDIYNAPSKIDDFKDTVEYRLWHW